MPAQGRTEGREPSQIMMLFLPDHPMFIYQDDPAKKRGLPFLANLKVLFIVIHKTSPAHLPGAKMMMVMDMCHYNHGCKYKELS